MSTELEAGYLNVADTSTITIQHTWAFLSLVAAICSVREPPPPEVGGGGGGGGAGTPPPPTGGPGGAAGAAGAAGGEGTAGTGGGWGGPADVAGGDEAAEE